MFDTYKPTPGPWHLNLNNQAAGVAVALEDARLYGNDFDWGIAIQDLGGGGGQRLGRCQPRRTCWRRL